MKFSPRIALTKIYQQTKKLFMQQRGQKEWLSSEAWWFKIFRPFISKIILQTKKVMQNTNFYDAINQRNTKIIYLRWLTVLTGELWIVVVNLMEVNNEKWTCRRMSPSSKSVAQTISTVDHCLIIFFFLVEQVSGSTSQMCCKAVAKEDQLPVIQLWDLRQATAPINTFEGHQTGILAMDWCPEVVLFQHTKN